MIKKYFKSLFVYLLFIFLTVVSTYPIIFKIRDHLIGFYSTDEPFAGMWISWWLKYSWVHHLPVREYSAIAAPFGMEYFPFSIFPLWEFINKWLTILTNPVATYNIEALFSFFLAGIFMYYLVNFVTKNKHAAVFSGIIYAFCPYHFVRAWQHLGLAQIQWMPLYLLSLFVLMKETSRKNIIIAAVCYYLILAFDFYYAYFMLIATIIFIVYSLLFSKADKMRALKSYVSVGMLILILVSPVIFAIVKGTLNVNAAGIKDEYGIVRPFKDLFAQSAKPLSYLLPASVHPVFGKFTENFLGSELYGKSLTEHTLYLGWTSLILAFVALKRWRKMRKVGTVPFGDSPYHKENFYIGFFILLAIAAWLFSQPPWWKMGPIKIYMPSFFIYKILPMIRAYCRFGILLMLAVAVLAGFGMKFILKRFKSFKTQIFLTCLFSGLVLFEFWNYPPIKIINLSEAPLVYAWLKTQAEDMVIAEYPIDINGGNVMYMFYQTKHEKKMINSTIPGTPANKVAKSIVKLSQPYTAGVLKWMGVKYALVHRDDYLNTELTEDKEELYKIPKNPGLKFIKDFPIQECPQKDIICIRKTGPIDVYEVVAQPIVPEIKER